MPWLSQQTVLKLMLRWVRGLCFRWWRHIDHIQLLTVNLSSHVWLMFLMLPMKNKRSFLKCLLPLSPRPPLRAGLTCHFWLQADSKTEFRVQGEKSAILAFHEALFRYCAQCKSQYVIIHFSDLQKIKNKLNKNLIKMNKYDKLYVNYCEEMQFTNQEMKALILTQCRRYT